MRGKFTEHQRWGVLRTLNNMSAWHDFWDIHFEVACDECPTEDLQSQLEMLERHSSKREIVSLNSAFRKAGYDVTFEYLEDNYWI